MHKESKTVQDVSWAGCMSKILLSPLSPSDPTTVSNSPVLQLPGFEREYPSRGMRSPLPRSRSTPSVMGT